MRRMKIRFAAVIIGGYVRLFKGLGFRRKGMPTIQVQVAVTLGDDTLKTLADLLGAAFEKALSNQGNGHQGSFQHRSGQKNPLFAGKEPPTDQGTLITMKEVAALMQVSQRHVTRLRDTGEMPPPLKIGRAIRWSREVILKWIADGCPKVGIK
ncbi:MAG: DNA-binding protein [Gemmataceae bacterium]|nr:DNA-binding protein [Gemmataceae bacterium]